MADQAYFCFCRSTWKSSSDCFEDGMRFVTDLTCECFLLDAFNLFHVKIE